MAARRTSNCWGFSSFFLWSDRLSLLGLINSFDTFCDWLTYGTNSAPLTISKMRGNCLVKVTDGEKKWRQGQDEREQRKSTFVTCESWHRGCFCDEIETRRRKLLAKSPHYGLFSHLAQSTPGSIWTPLRQPVYYSGPIWCSQQKNVIALPCLCLPCIVIKHSAACHYSRCCVTQHLKV